MVMPASQLRNRTLLCNSMPYRMPAVRKYFEKQDPAGKQHRYYSIRVSQTLFSDWAMIREWGRIGQRGTVRETWYDTEADALAARQKLAAQKQRRGYHARP